MGHCISTHLTGHLHQSASDQRPRQCCGEGVAPLVQRVSADGREGELFDEGLNQIPHQRLTRAGIQRLLTNRFQLIALAEISGEGDDLFNTPFLLQIGNADAGIHPAGVGENHLVGAAHQRVS